MVDTKSGGSYNRPVGAAFIFNLIVGIGALELPYAFKEAGLVLGPLFMGLMAFLAYVSVTYLIEAMSVANAMLVVDSNDNDNVNNNNNDDSDNNGLRPNDQEDNGNTTMTPADAEEPAEQTPLISSNSNFNSNSNSHSNLNHRYHTHSFDPSPPPSPSPSPSPTMSPSSSSHALLSYPFQDKNNTDEKQDDSEATTKIQSNTDYPEGNSIFALNQRIEVGMLTEMFMGRIGKILFYIVISVYLYGDLAIYASAVPQSLDKNLAFLDSAAIQYRIYVAIFAVCVVPFCFMNFSKTKYLQLTTMTLRNAAFFLMVILGFVVIGKGTGSADSCGDSSETTQAAFPDSSSISASSMSSSSSSDGSGVSIFNLRSIPLLYGVSVYSFMCHHSLPSLVTPIRKKKHLLILFLLVFGAIYLAYFSLCFTASLSFDYVNPDLYIYNFKKDCISWLPTVIHYFLNLFPVFTLTTNYPLICITLRNNLKTLISVFIPVKYHSRWWFDHLFSAMASFPPIVVAAATSNVHFLVEITGSFAGLFIQFIFPAFLAFFARKKAIQDFSKDKNPYRSPFSHTLWVVLLLVFSIISLGLNIYNLVSKAIGGSGTKS